MKKETVISSPSTTLRINSARNLLIMRFLSRIRSFEMTYVLISMTSLGFILFLTFAPSAIANDLSPWTEANTKYQSGDFKGALASYEEVLKSDKETAALDYNLGNTHFRLGHKGKALVFYNRALRISPRNEDILWNIDIVKSAVADRIDETDQNLTLVLIEKVTNQVTMNEFSILLTALLGLYMFLALLRFMWPMTKPVVQSFGAIVTVFFLVTALLAGFKWFDVKDAHLVILDKEVEARYGPSVKETKAFTLHEGTEAKIIDESKDWVYVTLDNKSLGWIPKKSCEVI